MDDQAIFAVREKVLALEHALLGELPTMPTILQDIHRTLKRDPDLVTILTTEEEAVIVKGLMKQTSVSTIAKIVKKAPSKKLSSTSLDDL